MGGLCWLYCDIWYVVVVTSHHTHIISL